jgi:hypothetical protein
MNHVLYKLITRLTKYDMRIKYSQHMAKINLSYKRCAKLTKERMEP